MVENPFLFYVLGNIEELIMMDSEITLDTLDFLG